MGTNQFSVVNDTTGIYLHILDIFQTLLQILDNKIEPVKQRGKNYESYITGLETSSDMACRY